MGQAISKQHPAVVLRSHYNHVRALLAIAMIAVVGLTVAVVVVASDDSSGTPASVRSQGVATPGDIRYDGGPEEGTADVPNPTVQGSSTSAPDIRYDGGPEEGTRGPGN
jgi:hypothetical protein